jgi:hypothetical protein
MLNTADNDTVYCDSEFRLFSPSSRQSSSSFSFASLLPGVSQFINASAIQSREQQQMLDNLPSRTHQSQTYPQTQTQSQNVNNQQFSFLPAPVALLDSFQYHQQQTQTQTQIPTQTQTQTQTQVQQPQPQTQTQLNVSQSVNTSNQRNMKQSGPMEISPTVASLPPNLIVNNNNIGGEKETRKERQFTTDYEMALYLQQEDEKKIAEQ